MENLWRGYKCINCECPSSFSNGGSGVMLDFGLSKLPSRLPPPPIACPLCGQSMYFRGRGDDLSCDNTILKVAILKAALRKSEEKEGVTDEDCCGGCGFANCICIHNQPTPWQPIETAPSWTDLIVYLPEDSWEEEVTTSYFDDDKKCWLTHLYDDQRQPTHWMPLPPPPKKES